VKGQSIGARMSSVVVEPWAGMTSQRFVRCSDATPPGSTHRCRVGLKGTRMSIAQVGAALRPFMVALLAAQQRGHRFGNGQRRLRRDNQPTPSPTSSVKSVGSALAEAGRSGGYRVVLVYEAAENVVAPNVNRVKVSWQPPANDRGAEITGYEHTSQQVTQTGVDVWTRRRARHRRRSRRQTPPSW
jgi:hypothetical protein